jgi:hypothetical protein
VHAQRLALVYDSLCRSLCRPMVREGDVMTPKPQGLGLLGTCTPGMSSQTSVGPKANVFYEVLCFAVQLLPRALRSRTPRSRIRKSHTPLPSEAMLLLWVDAVSYCGNCTKKDRGTTGKQSLNNHGIPLNKVCTQIGLKAKVEALISQASKAWGLRAGCSNTLR